jgi:hypothetical protein
MTAEADGLFISVGAVKFQQLMKERDARSAR